MPFWDRWRGGRHGDQDTRERLRASVAAFLAADDWPASRRVVEQHLELLSLEADACLRELAEEQADEAERAAIEEHRALLARCRVAGIAQAFAEKQYEGPAANLHVPPEVLLALINASLTGDAEEERRLLAKYPELRPEGDAGPGEPPAGDESTS